MTIKGFKNGAEFKVAERDGNGVWKSLGTMDSDSWACEISNDEFTKDSNNINWKFHWDTSKVADVAQKDVVVTARAEDKGKAGLNGDTIVYGTPNTSENDTYQMDVVPYIKAIYRNGSYNTNRAKSGAIPMLRGQIENCIEGFNLGDANSTITVVLTTNKDGTGTSYAMTNLTKWGTSTAFTMIDTARDGYLSTTVNEICSINNMNSNSPAYNREGNEYNATSTYWTDDRYVRVWENYSNSYFPGSDIPIYPAMTIASNGDLYASFSNYSDSRVYYSKKVTDPASSSATSIFYTYDPPEETDICVTSTNKINVLYSANYHGGNGDSDWKCDSTASGGLYVYDSQAKTKSVSKSSPAFNKFELFYHNKMLQQFKNFRVKRSNVNNDGLIHTAYFDKVTSSIHYSNAPGNGQQGQNSNEYSWVNIDGGYDSDDTKEYYNSEKSIYLKDGAFESDVSRATGTGEYVGLALTKSAYPVVVYYDATNKVLKLARGLKENPKGAIDNWKVQKVIDNKSFIGVSVESITCEIDSDGCIHIAFQNGKNQLVYIKSTNASANGNAKYTFTDPVVVAEGASWVDMTLFGTIPYISYISGTNSYDGMNLAFFDSNIDTNFDGAKDGAWESMVAPLAYKVTSIRTCVEVHPNMTTNGIGWEAAVGFTPGDKYRYALYIGSGAGH